MQTFSYQFDLLCQIDYIIEYHWIPMAFNTRGAGWIAKDCQGISGLEIKAMQCQLTVAIVKRVSVASTITRSRVSIFIANAVAIHLQLTHFLMKKHVPIFKNLIHIL